MNSTDTPSNQPISKRGGKRAGAGRPAKTQVRVAARLKLESFDDLQSLDGANLTEKIEYAIKKAKSSQNNSPM